MPDETVKWDDARSLFDWDGSLRDLYVFGTTREDWERLFGALKAAAWRIEFTRNGEPIAPPDSLDEYFDVTPDRPGGVLSIFVGRVSVNSYMFVSEEIELDIDPREVADAEQYEGVVGFMKFVADTLSKQVVLTPENGPEHPLLVAHPGSSHVIAGKSWLR